MRNHALAFALALAAVLMGSVSLLSAQSKAAANGKTGNWDRHDLSGVWMDDHPRPNTVMERYWIYKFTLEEPPMTAWGEAKFKAAKSSFGSHPYPLAETNDPIFRNCAPTGFPRVVLHPFPFKIVQIPGEVIVLYEWDSIRREIYTDGRGHDDTFGPRYNGDAIGHWEGDALVVDTTNFNDKTWLDRMGHPHSEQLHIVERITRSQPDRLIDEMTFEDPKAYSHPWSTRLEYKLHPDWNLQEQYCEDQESFEKLENEETAPAKK